MFCKYVQNGKAKHREAGPNTERPGLSVRGRACHREARPPTEWQAFYGTTFLSHRGWASPKEAGPLTERLVIWAWSLSGTELLCEWLGLSQRGWAYNSDANILKIEVRIYHNEVGYVVLHLGAEPLTAMQILKYKYKSSIKKINRCINCDNLESS